MEAKMEKQPIKIIKLINGDDIVCSLPLTQLGEKSPLLRLNRPLQVKYIPQFTAQGLKDYVALIKWSPYTRDAVLTIPKDKILTIVNANPDMCKSYTHVVLGYDKSEPIGNKEASTVFKRERLSDEDNDRVNEIFDEDDLDDYDIPTKTVH
tara:strand:+ start:15 stop:467 length:453 start_codon:yes stop_codon:yes gene_type:complete